MVWVFQKSYYLSIIIADGAPKLLPKKFEGQKTLQIVDKAGWNLHNET